ncbi:SprB repeat-containing protein, partial [Rhodocytophaga aerolata]|uniref:SprB repeat-containing protein n=1 Tax=Rhodocytophaga aerolata TaxID=455078 RepID=UPI00361391E7
SPYWSRPVGQGKHVVWTGDWGIFPGLLFMFGQMEEHESPYTNSSVVNNPVTIPLSISTTIKPILCYGQSSGSAVVSATGGVPPYRYQWSNGATSPALEKL